MNNNIWLYILSSPVIVLIYVISWLFLQRNKMMCFHIPGIYAVVVRVDSSCDIGTAVLKRHKNAPPGARRGHGWRCPHQSREGQSMWVATKEQRIGFLTSSWTGSKKTQKSGLKAPFDRSHATLINWVSVCICIKSISHEHVHGTW